MFIRLWIHQKLLYTNCSWLEQTWAELNANPKAHSAKKKKKKKNVVLLKRLDANGNATDADNNQSMFAWTI